MNKKKFGLLSISLSVTLAILSFCNNANAQHIEKRAIQEVQKYFDVSEDEIKEADEKITEIVESEEFPGQIVEPILSGAAGAVPGILMKKPQDAVSGALQGAFEGCTDTCDDSE